MGKPSETPVYPHPTGGEDTKNLHALLALSHCGKQAEVQGVVKCSHFLVCPAALFLFQWEGHRVGNSFKKCKMTQDRCADKRDTSGKPCKTAGGRLRPCPHEITALAGAWQEAASYPVAHAHMQSKIHHSTYTHTPSHMQLFKQPQRLSPSQALEHRHSTHIHIHAHTPITLPLDCHRQARFLVNRGPRQGQGQPL